MPSWNELFLLFSSPAPKVADPIFLLPRHRKKASSLRASRRTASTLPVPRAETQVRPIFPLPLMARTNTRITTVPDFYGEKISSVAGYRQWLKDQRAYNKKRTTFI